MDNILKKRGHMLETQELEYRELELEYQELELEYQELGLEYQELELEYQELELEYRELELEYRELGRWRVMKLEHLLNYQSSTLYQSNYENYSIPPLVHTSGNLR